MWSNFLFSVFLIGLSVWLLVAHASAWRHAREGEGDEQELDFHRRQFRRRMQASAMLGLVGLGVTGGVWIDAQGDTILSICFWLVLLLIVIWMSVLALADWLASRFYYDQIHSQQQAEHAALQAEQAAIQAELDRLRSREGNGRGDPS